MANYRPRRATRRWLTGAPAYVLSVHDSPKYCDRYTVFFTGHLWDPSMDRTVQYLALCESPSHPQGFSQWGELTSYSRVNAGRKIRWLDLPENVRAHVVARAAG